MSIINTHSHLLNFQCVPDSFFKAQSSITEDELKSGIGGLIAKIVAKIMRTGDYRYIDYMLELMKKELLYIAKTHLKQMDAAGILISTPLMMDLEIASECKPEIPYLHQIELISDITAFGRGRFLPFVMVDPRRGNAYEIMIEALENMGFLGVKLYPMFGYNLDPCALYDLEYPKLRENLRKMFAYCEKNFIPITTHCTQKGAYSNQLIKCKEFGDYLSHPKHIIALLKDFPNLKINAAHFGGDLHLLHEKSEELSWAGEIIKEIKTKSSPGLFTDLAYQDKAYRPEWKDVYFKNLNEQMMDSEISEKVLYGSDWSMISHTWTESQYTEAFRKNLSATDFEKITFENPMKFLFNDGKLPKRIEAFFEKKQIEILPEIKAIFR